MYLKHYSASFRAALVRELLKGEKSVEEIAFEYGVSVKRILQWHKYFEQDDLEISQMFDDQIDALKANNQ